METETDLSAVFAGEGRGHDVVLIDCVTLWVNNILFTEESRGATVDDSRISLLCDEWLEAAHHFAGTVICVTNEVGLGIVPENAQARKYRDLVGTCNQLIGRKADEVILVSCGIPLVLKINNTMSSNR
jgi:adenosylcobinamide kinase/adenosylcobinamide-phosphate guanylyltransferase